MLLDDPLENRRIAGGVPRAFRIDDGDRSPFEDTQAVCFRAQDAALLGETELFKAALEELQRSTDAVLVADLRIGFYDATKRLAPRYRDADALRDVALRLRCRTHSDPIRCPARRAGPCSRRAPRRRPRRGWRGSLRRRAPCDSASCD